MKLKRLLATALVFALVLTLGVASVAADISSYNDLPAPGSWNYDAIVSAIENGVFSGEGGFIRPAEFITIGQMYIYSGNALGVVLGTPSNSTAIATREDMFVLLAELVGAELSALDSVDTYLKGFGDFASISTSARTPIAALIKAGYITGVQSGSTASLYPKNQLSRSEFAVIAHRIFGQYVNASGTISGDINGNITIRSPGVTLSNNIITGDLIIGGSTRNIDVNLNGATVRGRTIVRGPATLTANSRSTVGIVHSYSDLSFSGDATTINVRGQSSNIKLNGGWLRNLNLESDSNIVSMSTGTEVAFVSIDGSSNSVTGNGSVENVSLSGSSNKFEIAGANVVSDTGRNNITSTKTGTFNITSVEITGNTTIVVTFDDKIQTAPASAFTLSGSALNDTRNRNATPDSTSINGSSVTLTFTGASFYYSNSYNSATITVSDGVIAVNKAKISTKSMTSGYGNYGYDPTVTWNRGQYIKSISSSGSGRNITVTVTLDAGRTSGEIEFYSDAYSFSKITGTDSDIAKIYDDYNYGGGWSGNWNGNWNGNWYYDVVDGTDYRVYYDNSGRPYFTRGSTGRIVYINETGYYGMSGYIEITGASDNDTFSLTSYGDGVSAYDYITYTFIIKIS